jgi:SAM-dependent methyltransferase
VWLESAQTKIAAVEVWSGSIRLGETRALYERPDVAAALALPSGVKTGFELYAHHAHPEAGHPVSFWICVRLSDGTRTPALANATVAIIGRDYRRNHFGVLLDQRTTNVQRRSHIYAEGPSLAQGSAELALLLRRYLGAPPRRIVDVGCGVGSYGRELLADGYDWHGVEIDAADCAELARLGLPHQRTDGRTLPFPDGSFDTALCLDVLEHIDDPSSFLREVSRVAPRQLIVSVPNCELLGYLWDHLAAPWHMLEGDHKNFFTRWSVAALLRQHYADVEVRFYGPYPLRTVEGTPLHYHLFAVATQPRPAIES